MACEGQEFEFTAWNESSSSTAKAMSLWGDGTARRPGSCSESLGVVLIITEGTSVVDSNAGRPRAPSAEEVVRLLLGQEVGKLIQFDSVARQGDDPAGVHQLRVNARRLRSELKVVGSVLQQKTLCDLDEELHWMGSILGRQRDLDVLDNLLRFTSANDSAHDTSSVFLNLAEQRAHERKRVARLLNSKRYRRLVVQLSSAVIDPPLRRNAREPALQVLLPTFQSTVSEFFRSTDAWGPNPPNDALHRIRISAKQCRYSADIASNYLGPEAHDVANALRKVQTVLGKIHDSTVATTYLEEFLHSVEQSQSGEAREAITSMLVSLSSSVDKLKTQWRKPFEKARSSSRTLVHPRAFLPIEVREPWPDAPFQ